VQLQVAAAETTVCRVGVVGRDDGRRRPRVRCEALRATARERGAARDELLENPYTLWSEVREPRVPDVAAPGEPSQPAPPTSAAPEAATEARRAELLGSPYERSPDDLADRVRLLEVRLDRLERAVRELARSRSAPPEPGSPEP
jgi:hypothetical protein